MRFASIRDFRANVSSIFSKAMGEEAIIVTARGKPVALFVPATEAQIEDMLEAIKAARLRSSVEQLRRESRRAGSDRLSAAAIETEIKAARRARHA